MTRNKQDPALQDFDNLYEEFKLQDTILEQQLGNGRLPTDDDPKVNPWTGLIIKTSPFPFLTPKPGKWYLPFGGTNFDTIYWVRGIETFVAWNTKLYVAIVFIAWHFQPFAGPHHLIYAVC